MYRKRNHDHKWGFHSKIFPKSLPGASRIFKDERQDTFDSDTDLEITLPTITKKLGRNLKEVKENRLETEKKN